MKELQNIKEAFDALLSSFDEAGIKDNTYDEWAKRTKRREPQQSKVELAKHRFIEKWNGGYQDTEQQLEFGEEMREDLNAIIDALEEEQ